MKNQTYRDIMHIYIYIYIYIIRINIYIYMYIFMYLLFIYTYIIFIHIQCLFENYVDSGMIVLIVIFYPWQDDPCWPNMFSIAIKTTS